MKHIELFRSVLSSVEQDRVLSALIVRERDAHERGRED